MSDILILAVFLSFVVFLAVPGPGKFAAAAGWCFIVLNLWSEMPALLQEKNFLYPSLALLSLPFLAITVLSLVREDPAAMQLSRTAAVASVIFAPFALIPVVRDTLVSLIIGQVFLLVTALGYQPVMPVWDLIVMNGFPMQLVLTCTGIFPIAMMLGVAYGAPGLSRKQAICSFLLVVPVIFVLNLLRVVAVFIAVSDRWFSSFPDPTGTGDGSFFWAHNVFAEGLAIMVVLGLLYGLFRINPGLATFGRELGRTYRDRVRVRVILRRD